MSEDERKQKRRDAILLLAIGFAIADRIGAGAPRARPAGLPFDDAEAFVTEAERRGMDPGGKLGE